AIARLRPRCTKNRRASGWTRSACPGLLRRQFCSTWRRASAYASSRRSCGAGPTYRFGRSSKPLCLRATGNRRDDSRSVFAPIFRRKLSIISARGSCPGRQLNGTSDTMQLLERTAFERFVTRRGRMNAAEGLELVIPLYNDARNIEGLLEGIG